MKPGNRKGGFTLVEALVAAVILLIGVMAISVAVSSGQMQMYHAVHAQRGAQLAGELMARVLALPYFDPDGASAPGPEVGETSVLDFDNADDFHGYSQAPGQVRDVAGNLYPASFQVFSRSVTVEYGSESVPGLGNPIPGLTVTVTVQDSKGLTWTSTRFVRE